MLIKKECISTNNSLTPIIHQGNLQKHSHSVTVLNTWHNVLWICHMPYAKDSAHYGQKD